MWGVGVEWGGCHHGPLPSPGLPPLPATRKSQEGKRSVLATLARYPQPPAAVGGVSILAFPFTLSLYGKYHKPLEYPRVPTSFIPTARTLELTLAFEDEAPPATLPGHVLKAQEAGIHTQALTPLPHTVHITWAHLGYEGDCRESQSH